MEALHEATTVGCPHSSNACFLSFQVHVQFLQLQTLSAARAPPNMCSKCGTSAGTDTLEEDFLSSSRKRARSSTAARTPQPTQQQPVHTESQLHDHSMYAKDDQSFAIDMSNLDMGDLPSGATGEQKMLVCINSFSHVLLQCTSMQQAVHAGSVTAVVSAPCRGGACLLPIQRTLIITSVCQHRLVYLQAVFLPIGFRFIRRCHCVPLE